VNRAGTAACVPVALLALVVAAPARAERLVASLSSHVVQINSNFTGVELTLFGTVERDEATVPHVGGYDIVATITGPRQSVVLRKKQRMLGIWVNADSYSFSDAPSYLTVLSNRPFQAIANADTLRQQQIGIENIRFGGKADAGSGPGKSGRSFRDSLVRIKQDHLLYGETTNAVTFLTPTLYRASIYVPAEAIIGSYDVDVKLFADDVMVARAGSAFELATVGFERFIAGAAVDHGVLYGLAAAAMALLTGWLASIVFRRD
jgi:uncharacterized protein (TIGR02186 family)